MVQQRLKFVLLSKKDILPHENAIGNVKKLLNGNFNFMAKGLMAEDRATLDGRVQAAVAHGNENYGWASLCRHYPKRMRKLVATDGANLPH